MKKILLILFIIFSIKSFSQFAPESEPHRGMYIDKFVKTDFFNTSYIDPAFSVLAVDTNLDGIFENEDKILKYAAENHITYLALYDLHRIFGRHVMVWDEGLKRNADLEEHLCRFIKKAKSQYGITQIGAIGGSARFFDSLSTYMNRFPQADFDVVNTEFEFWVDCPNEFPNFIPILNSMYSMKESYNLAHPSNPIISEAYLAALFYCNSSFGNIPVVQTIDGCNNCSPCTGCPNPQPQMADRILHAWYISNPGSANIGEQNFFENSLTKDSTDFHPILYAESYNTGGTVDWTGAWFPLAPTNNIFTAEEAYYSSWRNNSAVAFGTPRQNNVQPGGVQWFTSTNMAGHLDHPQILQNTGPYCSVNPTTRVTFNYFGPIEYNIIFQFWITRDTDSVIVYPTAGGKINGISEVYQPLTFSTQLHKNIDFSDSLIFPVCYLPSGEYTAHLLLKYNGGQGESYQCDNSVIIESRPRLEINGRTQFCEGDYTYLQTNNSGGTITWYRNGIQIPGNNSSLLVNSDGDYHCSIMGGGGCAGISDTIHIHVLSNPAIAINSFCNGNSTVTLKTNLLTANSTSTITSGPGGVLYRWNTNATTDQITVTPPSTNTTYRVNVTNPYTGCMRTGQITVKSPLPSPYSSSILINSQPSSSCSSDGSLTAVLNAGGAPNNYLWSNGATTATISNLAPGTYSVAMNVWAGGCTSYASATIGSAPANAPIVQSVIQFVTCSGQSDGSIQLNVSGVNPPFKYFWEFFPDDSVHNPFEKDQSDLFEGIYNVRITDNSGCNYFETFNVTYINQSPYISSFTTNSVTNCTIGNDGSASVVAAGGNPPYTYLWNDALLQTTPAAGQLTAGSYQVKVSDSFGCSVKKYISVPLNEELLRIELIDSSKVNVSCIGEQDGSLFINIQGGNGPYNVSSPWTSDSNFAMLTSLSSGTYLIQISDAAGCMLTDSFQIKNPEEIHLFSSSTPTSCIGCPNGYFDISFSGGTPPYTISWSPSVGILNGNRIQDLSNGVYSVCVTDIYSCMSCIQDTITESTSGIFELDMNTLLNVYPNPYSESATVSLSNELFKSGIIIICSMDGRVVFSREISSLPYVIMKNELVPGIYFIRLIDEQKRMLKRGKKLVVME